MKIKVIYSKSQLEACIDFVASHNENFYGKKEYIRQQIRQSIQTIINGFPDTMFAGTMGFYVMKTDTEIEDMDNDENSFFVEFLVDPVLGQRNWTDDDYQSEYSIIENEK